MRICQMKDSKEGGDSRQLASSPAAALRFSCRAIQEDGHDRNVPVTPGLKSALPSASEPTA